MLDPNEVKASSTQTECIQGLMTFLERFGRRVFINLLLTLKLAGRDWSQRHFLSNLPPVHRSPPQIVLDVAFGYFHRLLWVSHMNFPHLIRVIRGYLRLLAACRKPKWIVVTCLWCVLVFFSSSVPNPLSPQKGIRTHLLYVIRSLNFQWHLALKSVICWQRVTIISPAGDTKIMSSTSKDVFLNDN